MIPQGHAYSQSQGGALVRCSSTVGAYVDDDTAQFMTKEGKGLYIASRSARARRFWCLCAMELKIDVSGKAVHAGSVVACVHQVSPEKGDHKLRKDLEKDPKLGDRLSRSDFKGGRGERTSWACSTWGEVAVLVEEKHRDGEKIQFK